ASLEKRHVMLATGGEDALARLLHLGRIGIARHRSITEREAEIAGPQFGKAETGHGEDFLTMSDPLGAFQLDAEQKLAFRIERPGVTAFEIFSRRNAPTRSGGRFRAAAARADAEPTPVRRIAGAAHPLDRRWQSRINPGRLMGIAAGFDKG